MQKIYDVAIIGYGPVGATLANFLGKDGWRVAIIEASPEPFPIPRAVHCDDEAQRIWQDAGVLDLLQSAWGGYPSKRQYINAKGNVYFETQVTSNYTFGYQGHMYFHQPTLEVGLRQGVSRYPNVDTFLSTAAVALEHTADHIKIQTQQQPAGQTGQIAAKYVVGCDGSSSFVRKTLGIQLEDLNHSQRWLVTDFYLKPGLSREDVGLPHAHQQICDPAQPISFYPQGAKNHYRFEFMLPDGVTKEEAKQQSYLFEKLSSLVDVNKIDLVRGAVYAYQALVAEKWRNGRAFIVGDAAHQMPSFAGQGLSSGLRDVQNLSWKLSLVLSGAAEDSLLNSYEDERKPHVTRMTRGAIFLGDLVHTKSAFRAWVRDVLFNTVFKVPALFGQIAGYALRAPALETNLRIGWNAEAVGTWFIQPQVTDPAGNGYLLDQLLGSGFAVIGLNIDPSPYFKLFENKLPLRCVQISSTAGSGQIYDHTGALAEWFRAHQTEFVIVRPDRFVLGTYSQTHIDQAAAELAECLNIRL